MKTQPIQAEADYDEALGNIEKLWGSPQGTPDGDLLDVLLVLVEDYESRNHPIEPPDPFEVIEGP